MNIQHGVDRVRFSLRREREREGERRGEKVSVSLIYPSFHIGWDIQVTKGVPKEKCKWGVKESLNIFSTYLLKAVI